MKVIIPVAGKGTRLRPHTHLTPKPLLKIAGKPVIDYVMDDLAKLGGVEEVIYITGHLKEDFERYARAKYPWKSVFIEQKEQRGTADAIGLARQHVDQPVMVIFVDTIFDADLSIINRSDADGIIWTKEVEDYQRFGVIITRPDQTMERIVEKPKEPVSKLCDEFGLQPTVFYRWQKEFFENGAAAFQGNGRKHHPAEQERIEFLEKKIQRKDEVLAELMAEHIALKKELGEL